MRRMRAGGGQARFVANADGTPPNRGSRTRRPAGSRRRGGARGRLRQLPDRRWWPAGGRSGCRRPGGAPAVRAGAVGRPRPAAMPEGYTEPVHDARVRLQTDGLERARSRSRRQHSARLVERRSGIGRGQRRGR